MLRSIKSRSLVPGGLFIRGYGSDHGKRGARGAKNLRKRYGYQKDPTTENRSELRESTLFPRRRSALTSVGFLVNEFLANNVKKISNGSHTLYLN
ncbi:hypothetical protein EVAR_42728_1 [Eumeta japonica]|uniref:Uncharacterized protein n=1 Tax=Eumeta variegata TaxID=151549 RepID=A0A4C1XIB4_EUMVA|nr:hypothetical protein EVAR_42728_1 [Eumeta japonica]